MLSSNGPNPNEEKLYIGDMDCDGVAEKQTTWQYYDSKGRWVDTQIRLCPNLPTCDVVTDCYLNDERPGTPLACGNTEITIARGGVCQVIVVEARVACR